MRRDAIYNEMCRLLNEFEEGYLDISEGEDAEELYRLVGEIKASWADITAQGAPTIDPVKHGKWIKNEDGHGWRCSECKETNYYAYSWNSENGEYEFQDRYCPCCGAKMEYMEDE